MEDFVHLHVHTQYSILDGQAAIPKLVDKAINNGMRGMAVTDHGNMFGIKEFFNYCNKVNKGKSDEEKFKPIFGCEVYCARRDLHSKENNALDKSGWHLILLAKNEVGYHNLVKIVSEAWVDGYYHRPRTDHQAIEKHHEGLIASSACLAGEIPRYIKNGQIEEAEKSIQWFKSIFGDDFYIELMRHEVKDPMQRANRDTYKEQKAIEPTLIELARKYNVKLICTNDSHFVDEENAEAHDRLLCLSTGKDLDDPNRMLYSKQEWFKTREEMNDVFKDIPEALNNTIEILNKVETYSIDHAPIMPFFAIPEDFGTEKEWREKFTDEDIFNEFTRDENGNVVLTQEEAEKKIKKLGGIDKLYRIKFEADYLKKITYDGAKRLYGDPVPDNVKTLLDFELHVMKTMGFPGYFLIVQDFINSARKELGVWVGPGRGSAAGSAVAYCLGITKIDPIKYDLLFERFLNPDRISLPDIDTDFDDDGRGKVLQWVTEKYGAEKVAHIITYGTMATKLAIKDVARVQKVPLAIVNALCKAIPDRLPNGKKMNLANAIECVPELKDAATSPDPLLRDTMRFAQMLENNVRNTGVHACGTIICRDAIDDWVPVSTAEDKETGEKLRCTQYDGHVIEETGLIKMDFLGLKTLSQLKEAVTNIKESLGIDINVDLLNIQDPATYQLYCDGRTVGTFQFESAGMQKYLRELQPNVFEDLIAMNALYRPGPMDYIPDFINRKQGRKPIEYDIPCMEKYLKDTYGITVYQEQVMLLSRQLADFTRGESDALRKAMGKKKKDIVDAMKPKFIEGGKKNGHDPKILDKIWSDWEKFASYAFNKSHATCYSWVAYQTAFLKANFPSQFMAAVMSRSLDNITEIRKLMDECKQMGINTLGPDVNESRHKFSVNIEGDIRFGMAAIKGVGESAVQAIIEEREKNGNYTSVFDFVERVNLSQCNKKNIENLVLAGAFDCFKDFSRETFFAPGQRQGETFLDVVVRYGNSFQQDKFQAQTSLFGGMEVSVSHPSIPKNIPTWGNLERLNKERELVGIYLSAHPLDEYSIILDYVCNTKLNQLEEQKEELSKMEEVTIGGIVTSVRTGESKNGSPYGIVKMEDFVGSGELPLFGTDWITYRNFFTEGSSLFIRIKVEPHRFRPGIFNINVKSVELMSEVKDKAIQKITFDVPLDKLTSTMVEDLAEIVKENPGEADLVFNIHTSDSNKVSLMSRNVKVRVGKQLVQYIKEHDEIGIKVN
ncbi:MAG: DNA polymerase III subunit alpha [Bacteroidaceae bacterium]|nr:DNA polymerase III subunit alpha [Bacteroidaceae bacterium]MBR1491459.1 DNA polymerase III subunit alpha [Bacteroidaceae bacterium]MDD7527696.1 DNA polymerase III subunit alpha [Prevotellaceae bacterium]MDY5761145.1 DNA polymerase III subunit alpha [Bacteroidaceae bacterium]MDY6257169.1 DNA polymerase III subunit alpha [Bacteroidaceae bacterium]